MFLVPHRPTLAPRCPTTVIADKIKQERAKREQKYFSAYHKHSALMQPVFKAVVSTPCHAGRGLAGHPRCVRVGNEWAFLTEHAAQLLVQALVISILDYCNALLAGLPSNTIKPLQMIQNVAARLVFNEPKRAHVTPLFVSLHWLPVAARIQFKTLMLAYRTTTGSAATYFHSLLRIYIPSRSLRSASERHLVVPSQRGSKSLSRTFSFTVPGRWNDLTTPIRNTGSLSIFKQQLKTHLFQLYLTT